MKLFVRHHYDDGSSGAVRQQKVLEPTDDGKAQQGCGSRSQKPSPSIALKTANMKYI